MSSVRLTRKQLEKKRNLKLKRLHHACVRFDQGDDDEAEEMAVILRTLWHIGRYTSLMSLLQFDGPLVDTSVECPPPMQVEGEDAGSDEWRIFSHCNRRTYAPLLSRQIETKPFVMFSEWWNNEVVRDLDGTIFSRRDIVLLVADKEGAHVDGAYSQRDYGLRYGSNNQYFTLADNGNGTFRRVDISPVPAIIRQIAHETLYSLVSDYSYNPLECYDSMIQFMSFHVTPN